MDQPNNHELVRTAHISCLPLSAWRAIHAGAHIITNVSAMAATYLMLKIIVDVDIIVLV